MSVNESATQNATRSKLPESQKKYKTEAEGALLALSGRPRILDFDDIWKQDAGSVKPKDFRVEDLFVTMVYYTHGVEGIRKLQIHKPETDKFSLYEISVLESQHPRGRVMKRVEVYSVQDGFRVSPLSRWKYNVLTRSRFG